MTINRRKFIQLSSLASASLLVPKFLKAFEGPVPPPVSGKKLVVIQLSGGNDGLNTVIPVRNDLYYAARPKIAIRREAALALTDEVGLHPAFTGLKSLYDGGQLSILNGVGYPEPNRSHFRSMDIWQSGSRADEVLGTGWIGRYLDRACKDCDRNTFAIEVDDALSLSMKGREKKALAIRDIAQFFKATHDPYLAGLGAKDHAAAHEAKLADYLYQTLSETVSAAGYVQEHYKQYRSTQAYPDSAIGKHLKTVASLLLTGADTRVFYVSHGSFDTHVAQAAQQERLFRQLDEALVAFVDDLKAAGQLDDVLIMTFSEFGRRVGENASGGTDHGTAGNMFFISGGLKKPGLYNSLPDLSDLDEGDLKYRIDFKQAYATILDRWMGMPHQQVLGGRYEPLSFI